MTPSEVEDVLAQVWWHRKADGSYPESVTLRDGRVAKVNPVSVDNTGFYGVNPLRPDSILVGDFLLVRSLIGGYHREPVPDQFKPPPDSPSPLDQAAGPM